MKTKGGKIKGLIISLIVLAILGVVAFFVIGYITSKKTAEISTNIEVEVETYSTKVRANLKGSGVAKDATYTELDYTTDTAPSEDALQTYNGKSFKFKKEGDKATLTLTIEYYHVSGSVFVDLVDLNEKLDGIDVSIKFEGEVYSLGSSIPLHANEWTEKGKSFTIEYTAKKLKKDIEATFNYKVIVSQEPIYESTAVELLDNKFDYDTEEKTATISQNSQQISTGNLEVPKYVKHKNQLYTITKVADYGFEGCSYTNVVLPETVTEIGKNAFANCTKLESFEMSENIENIGRNAFKNVPEAAFVSKNGGLYLGQPGNNYIFLHSADGYTNFVVEEGCRIINYDVFKDETTLTALTLPSTLYRINEGAFAGTGLTKVDVPEGVKIIESGAFQNCTNLSQVSIPDSLETLGELAFTGINDAAYTISDNGKYLGNKINKYILLQELSNKTIDSFLIQNNCKFIANEAFAGSTTLRTVTLVDTVKQIGKKAFYGCSDLMMLNIPEGVEIIGDETFAECTNLRRVIIPKSIISIGDSAFENCTSLIEVELTNVKEIGESAFAGCADLTEVVVPGSVKEISANLFENCTALTTVTLSEGVKIIEEDVFKNCTNLTTINVPDTITDFAFSAIEGLSTRACRTYKNALYLGNAGNKYAVLVQVVDNTAATFEIASTTKYIMEYTFANCTLLSQIAIPNSVTVVDDYAFAGCAQLSAVAMSENLEKLGEGAFMDCSSLEGISLPSQLIEISDYTFANCSNLENVYLSNNTKYVGDYAFYGCTKLDTDISSLWEIGEYAFAYSGITHANIQEEISSYAFVGCVNLTTVTLGIRADMVMIVDMFKDCTALETIIIDSVRIAYSISDASNYGGLLTNAKNVYIRDTITLVSTYLTEEAGFTKLDASDKDGYVQYQKVEQPAA